MEDIQHDHVMGVVGVDRKEGEDEVHEEEDCNGLHILIVVEGKGTCTVVVLMSMELLTGRECKVVQMGVLLKTYNKINAHD